MNHEFFRTFGRPVLCAELLVIALAILAAPSLALADGDVAAGRQKARACAGCHGLDGMARMPDAPNIGGESAVYLERQLEAFRSGERTHQQMSIIAKRLSDQDIADLAAYFSAIEVDVVRVPE